MSYSQKSRFESPISQPTTQWMGRYSLGLPDVIGQIRGEEICAAIWKVGPAHRDLGTLTTRATLATNECRGEVGCPFLNFDAPQGRDTTTSRDLLTGRRATHRWQKEGRSR